MDRKHTKQIEWNFRELYTIFHQILSIKNFFKVWTSFSQSGTFFQYGNFFFTRKISSRRLRGARLRPWALEAPLPLGELCKAPWVLGTCSLRRIVQSRSNLCWHLVVARSVATWQSCQRERIASPLRVSQWRSLSNMTDFLLGGYAMTNTTSLLEDNACKQACGATFALHAFAKAPFQGQFV